MSSTSEVVRLRKFNGTREVPGMGNEVENNDGGLSTNNEMMANEFGLTNNDGGLSTNNEMMANEFGLTNNDGGLSTNNKMMANEFGLTMMTKKKEEKADVFSNEKDDEKIVKSDSLSKESVRRRYSGTAECQSCDKVSHESARVGLSARVGSRDRVVTRARVVSREVSESGGDVVRI